MERRQLRQSTMTSHAQIPLSVKRAFHCLVMDGHRTSSCLSAGGQSRSGGRLPAAVWALHPQRRGPAAHRRHLRHRHRLPRVSRRRGGPAGVHAAQQPAEAPGQGLLQCLRQSAAHTRHSSSATSLQKCCPPNEGACLLVAFDSKKNGKKGGE